MIYKLEFDGYHQTGGDRLFENVMFVAEISVDGLDVTIGQINPRSDMVSFLKNIKWESSVEYMRSNLQHSIDYLVDLLKEQGRSFEDEMDDFHKECNEPGINVILEV